MTPGGLQYTVVFPKEDSEIGTLAEKRTSDSDTEVHIPPNLSPTASPFWNIHQESPKTRQRKNSSKSEAGYYTHEHARAPTEP